ncbi:hypothetical protein B0T20DRAFT_389991 [Sordaria brevicollis]|uniref:Uncharacterized protein n=1 Tax=Sordaria brevicollis TaxID=83679 RepID=A0AAE0UFP1_SORBR|nr:hypothetical protein B0T20DRAFT_389991 [Sordaria brevicollis]
MAPAAKPGPRPKICGCVDAQHRSAMDGEEGHDASGSNDNTPGLCLGNTFPLLACHWSCSRCGDDCGDGLSGRLSSRSNVGTSSSAVSLRLIDGSHCIKVEGMNKHRSSSRGDYSPAIVDSCGATARLVVDRSEDNVSDTANFTGQGLVWLNGLTQSARAAGTLLNEMVCLEQTVRVQILSASVRGAGGSGGDGHGVFENTPLALRSYKPSEPYT